ncbi:hypothetical protein FRC06_004714, partial [Ceratobasidium sp. 370]
MADWNLSKMFGMAAFLSSKYKEALKVYHFQRTEFLNLDACITDRDREVWEQAPLEAKEGPKGVWTSVFSTPTFN